MQEIVKNLEALFGPGLLDASDNYLAAKNGAEVKENTTADSGAKYSDRYVVAHENNDILSIVERISNGNFKANDKVYLGAVSTENAAKIQKLTGISVDGFKVAIEARQIEHILKRHSANGISDHSMANPSDIAKMEYTLNEPDSIINAGVSKAYNYMVNGRNKNAKTVLYEKTLVKNRIMLLRLFLTPRRKLYLLLLHSSGKVNTKKRPCRSLM